MLFLLISLIWILGPEWIFTFLTLFYEDNSRPMGVNNSLYPNVNMPHVLWYKEGLKTLDANGQVLLKLKGNSLKKNMSKKLDLVNFLTYVSEPQKILNWPMGDDISCVFCIYYIFLRLNIGEILNNDLIG